MYYRSGIDTYYTYAHTLALDWWTLPWIDRGNTCDIGGVYPCTANRIRAMEGLVTAALDGTLPDFWTGAEVYWEVSHEYAITVELASPLGDLRESSAALEMVAMFGLFEPNASMQQAAVAALGSSIANFWNVQQPGGLQGDGAYVSTQWQGGFPGTVSVANNFWRWCTSGPVRSGGALNFQRAIRCTRRQPRTSPVRPRMAATRWRIIRRSTVPARSSSIRHTRGRPRADDTGSMPI